MDDNIDELIRKLDIEFTMSTDDYYRRICTFRKRVYCTIKYRAGEWWVKILGGEYALINLSTLDKVLITEKCASINEITEKMILSTRSHIDWSDVLGVLAYLNIKYRYRKKYGLLYFGVYDPTILKPDIPSRDGFVVRITSDEVVYHNGGIPHSEYSIKILLNILVSNELA